MIVDNVTHDCRTCAHAQIINRFMAHCSELDTNIKRPRKCKFYTMNEKAQAFNKATQGVKL